MIYSDITKTLQNKKMLARLIIPYYNIKSNVSIWSNLELKQLKISGYIQ
jgi:hypothetical protein